MQHIEGEVRLDVPDIDWPSEDPDVNVRDELVRRKVEETCRNWHKQISAALDLLQNKTHQVETSKSKVRLYYTALRSLA